MPEPKFDRKEKRKKKNAKTKKLLEKTETGKRKTCCACVCTVCSTRFIVCAYCCKVGSGTSYYTSKML